MSVFTCALFQVRRIWRVILMALTALLGCADQFLPVFHGMIPPVTYVVLAVTLALLPSIMDRRSKDRK